MWPWLVWLSGLSMGCELKGRRFYSQSGLVPGLRARPLVERAHERQPHLHVFLPLFLSPFPSL